MCVRTYVCAYVYIRIRLYVIMYRPTGIPYLCIYVCMHLIAPSRPTSSLVSAKRQAPPECIPSPLTVLTDCLYCRYG